jgi:hypothetical protein
MFDRLRRWVGIGLAVFLLSVGFFALQTACASDESERVNRALLIGVDEFVSRLSTYPASTNNVFAIQETLQASSTPFDTIMIPDEAVTGAESLTRLIYETFESADSNDVSYLYLCTHGESESEDGEKAALLLSDGITEGRISPAQLEAAFNGIKGTKVILLDACYSGAFIGKGMRKQPKDVYFLGDDFKVLVSSGAMEESWFWNMAESAQQSSLNGYQQGAFYFTQALCQSLNPKYGCVADVNRDGNVTLVELYQTLLANHATSTPQVYPQNDDFIIFTYDPADLQLDGSQRSPIGDVTFSSSTLSAADPTLTLEYIALRPVRVAYQIVYQREGKWRFDEAQLQYDHVEQYTAYGDEQGAISPGRKVRTISLSLQNGDTYGYVLVQLVSIDGEKLTVHAGRVIAISPSGGDPALAVETASQYSMDDPRELAIFVRHAYPCQLSVNIVNEQGEVVRKLCHRQSTRPLKMLPEGSCFYWDGLDKNGTLAPAGQYHVQVIAYLGDRSFNSQSETFTVTPSQG